MTAHRPRRSALYVPGSNPRALEKAESLPADVVILDLEDAVAPEVKEAARAAVVAAAGRYGRREVLIRINGLRTPWGYDDLQAVASSGADGIVLPKVESSTMVLEAENALRQLGTMESPKIWCMIETPRGVLQSEIIACSSERLAGFIMGTSDLAKDLRCAHVPGRLPLVAALGHSVLAARAYGLAILDGVHLDLADDDGFAAACRQGREFGFDGKTLIHPKTIAAANAVFGPSQDDLTWARAVTAAYTVAEQAGQAVVLVDGKLVEALHVADARRVLAEAEAISALEAALS